MLQLNRGEIYGLIFRRDMDMSYFNNHNHTDMSNALLGFPDVICKIPV